MSTLSIAPEFTRTSGQARVRRERPRAAGTPSFDFGTPVPSLGIDDPAVRVLEVAPPSVVAPRTVRDVVATPAPLREVREARPVRLTRRGRLTLTLTFLGLVLAAMVAVGGSWATASLGSGAPVPVRTVEVQPGDTLYGIAASIAEPGEVRETVHRIQELNSLPSATIAEGQELAVPRG